MAEYSRLAKGRFTSTGAAQIINLPFQPDYVEILNYSVALAAPSANAVVSARWDINMGQGFALETGVYFLATTLPSTSALHKQIITLVLSVLQYSSLLYPFLKEVQK